MRLIPVRSSASGGAADRGTAASRPVRSLTAPVAAAALALAVVTVTTGVLPRSPVGSARADEVTASQDNLRTGWDSSEPGMAPVTDGGPVGGSSFGQIFKTHLNGQIYAQPLVAGQTLIVATETNHVYGLNAVTGAVQWSDYLGPAEPWTAIGCTDLTPDIGVTSAPVYDPSTGTVYLVAVVNNGPTRAQPHVYAYALNAQTGATQAGWPVAIHGSPVNDPSASFNPFSERQRAGLLLLNGWVYVAFASYCDYQPYAGYVAGVNTSSRALTLWSDEAGLTDSQGGIWQGSGGLMSDGAGRIFVATGNGVSPPAGPGTSPPPELGDSVVRLSVAADGALSAADFFSPANAPTLDYNDQDFGSGGPVGLPFGTAGYPDLLVQAGKDGRVFLLNRDGLGGREQGAGGADDVVSQSGPYAGQWGHPAAFGPEATVAAATSDDYVYYVGSGDVMRYLQFEAGSGGTPVLSDVANSSIAFGYSSGSPVVTSNGDDTASAVVWEVDSSGEQGTGASLQAFDAVPSGTCASTAPCTMSPIWSAPIGTASKFTIPATDGGRVYVGTRDGNVFGFGSPDMAPLAGSPVNFGKVAVGAKPRTETVTMTASASVSVTGLSVAALPGSDPFRLGAPSAGGSPARFPVTLSPAEKLTVPVTFTPVHTGGVAASVQAATSAANFPVISVSLTGQGTAAGLQASPAALSFGRRAEGSTVSKTVLITNASTAAEKITALRRPRGPFSARLPARGKDLKPGQSVGVQVTFHPAVTGNAGSSFAITTGRHVLTVGLSGSGKTAISRVSASHSVVRFGVVQLGRRATRTIVVTNDGNLPVVVSRATGPPAPFGVQAPSPAGLPLTPGYTVSLPVTFTPTGAGQVAGRYLLYWRDAKGAHVLRITLTGTGVASAAVHAVPPPGGGWTLNGTAAMRGRELALTRAARDAAGSAVYAVPQPGSRLSVRFTATLGGDGGMTFSLLPAGTASTRSVGGSGAKLGFGGLGGAAVTLATGRASGHRSGGYVGVAIGAAGGLRYVASRAVSHLTKGSHLIDVAVTGRAVKVSVDGKKVLSALLSGGTIPASALLAFTGAAGSAAGSQAVSGVTIRASGRSVGAPGGGWSFNGSAAMSGSSTTLTRAAKREAGTVVYPVAVHTNGLKVTFTAQLYGGSGANGLTFALLNPAGAKPASVGADGAALGVGGLGGVSVDLDTVQADQYSTDNIAEICTSVEGSATLSLLQRAEAIPPLRPGPSTVTVGVVLHGSSYVLTVWLDGEQILQQAVPVPATGPPFLGGTALLAFTGSTGVRSDVHLVRDIAISAGD